MEDITHSLYQKALAVRLNAYAPYSKYKVGAAIYTKNKKIYTGCNVENISFPCGTCAEAGAIAAMVAAGDSKIKALLVVSSGKDLVYPCGACLQRIAEFGDDDTVIYLANTKKICEKHTLQELLPYNFKEENIGK